ncbi:hypothetical protein [Streptomyces sp. NPDC093223]|uniref:hypothetical protein n=1 Tax=Streptomyces sp. NPDC093223 TaxID=3366033 RepID=UPI0037F328C4
MTSKPVSPITAVCLLLALGVAGCSTGETTRQPVPYKASGSGESAGVPSVTPGRSGADVLRESLKALAQAGSWHMEVNGANFDQDVSGDCVGNSTNQGYPAEVLKKRDEVWIRMRDAFWNAPQGRKIVAKLPDAKGKWIHGTTDSPSVAVSAAVIPCMFGEVGALEDGTRNAKATKGQVTDVDGVKAEPVRLTASNGQGDATFYVAAEGKPLPLKITARSDSGLVTVVFSGFGKRFTVPPSPSAAQTVSVAEYEKASASASVG